MNARTTFISLWSLTPFLLEIYQGTFKPSRPQDQPSHLASSIPKFSKMVCCLVKIWQPGPEQAARAVTASSKAASYPSLPLAMQFILENTSPSSKGFAQGLGVARCRPRIYFLLPEFMMYTELSLEAVPWSRRLLIKF